MKPGLSLWLDGLRGAAALTVVFGHLAHTRFTGGDYGFLREINIASDAVAVFFVLSGLVIAYAADRDGALAPFAFNRLTRLATVLVPALILTRVFDDIGVRLDPGAYRAPFYYQVPASDFWLRGLSLTSEWQGITDRLRLGSNGPLWSLSYEATYYAIFGAALFLRGGLRIAVIAVLGFFAGLPILALGPAWMVGVAVWRRIADGRAAALSVRAASLLLIVPPLMLVLLRVIGVPEMLSGLTAAAVHPVNHHALLGYSDEILWNYLIALAVAGHLLGVARLSAEGPRATGRIAGAIRWFAQGSFSLYVMHYPVLHLLDATLPESLPGYHLILLGGVLTVCYAFAAVFERPLKFYRAGVAGLFRGYGR